MLTGMNMPLPPRKSRLKTTKCDFIWKQGLYNKVMLGLCGLKRTASIIKKDQDPRTGGGEGAEVKERVGEVGVSSFKLRRLV